MILFGLGNLLPYNIIITCIDYLSHSFPNHKSDIEYVMIPVNQVPNIIAMIFMIRYGHKITFTKRIAISFFILTFFVAIIPFCNDYFAKQFSEKETVPYLIFLFIVSIFGILTAIIQTALFGFAALFPPKYSQALQIGQAIAGVLICFLRILTKLVLPNNLHGNGILYFTIGASILYLCGIAFLYLTSNFNAINYLCCCCCKPGLEWCCTAIYTCKIRRQYAKTYKVSRSSGGSVNGNKHPSKAISRGGVGGDAKSVRYPLLDNDDDDDDDGGMFADAESNDNVDNINNGNNISNNNNNNSSNNTNARRDGFDFDIGKLSVSQTTNDYINHHLEIYYTSKQDTSLKTQFKIRNKLNFLKKKKKKSKEKKKEKEKKKSQDINNTSNNENIKTTKIRINWNGKSKEKYSKGNMSDIGNSYNTTNTITNTNTNTNTFNMDSEFKSPEQGSHLSYIRGQLVMKFDSSTTRFSETGMTFNTENTNKNQNQNQNKYNHNYLSSTSNVNDMNNNNKNKNDFEINNEVLYSSQTMPPKDVLDSGLDSPFDDKLEITLQENFNENKNKNKKNENGKEEEEEEGNPLLDDAVDLSQAQSLWANDQSFQGHSRFEKEKQDQNKGKVKATLEKEEEKEEKVKVNTGNFDTAKSECDINLDVICTQNNSKIEIKITDETESKDIDHEFDNNNNSNSNGDNSSNRNNNNNSNNNSDSNSNNSNNSNTKDDVENSLMFDNKGDNYHELKIEQNSADNEQINSSDQTIRSSMPSVDENNIHDSENYYNNDNNNNISNNNNDYDNINNNYNYTNYNNNNNYNNNYNNNNYNNTTTTHFDNYTDNNDYGYEYQCTQTIPESNDPFAFSAQIKQSQQQLEQQEQAQESDQDKEPYQRYRNASSASSSSSSSEPSLISGSVPTKSGDIRYIDIFLKIKHLAFVNFGVMFVTFLIYPGLTTQIQSENDSLNGHSDWFALILITEMNIFDLIGRWWFATYIDCGFDQNNLWIATLWRILIYPLFIALAKGEIKHGDWLAYLGIAYLGSTNGMYCTLAYMHAPKIVYKHEQEIAGAMMSFSLVSGIACGSVVSLALRQVL